MGYLKKQGKNLAPDYVKTEKKSNKSREKHTHIILLAETHKQLKMMAAHRDMSISSLLEELAQQYISERGKF